MRHSVSAQQERANVRVLHWLEQYPLQRARDLVVALAPFEGRSSVYTRLADLKARHLIEAVRPAGQGEWLYHLSPRGQVACARWAGHHRVALSLSDERDKLIRLLPRLPVLLVVQDAINGLVSGAASALARQGRQADVIQWNWQRDVSQPFQPTGQQRSDPLTLRVDGMLTLRLRFTEEAAHWEEWQTFLVLSCPLTERRLLRQRLDRLVRWRESAEGGPPDGQMPTVVILATTPRQAEWWHLAALQVTRRFQVEMLRGAIAVLPAGDIGNSWHLSWRTLGTARSCHLQELTQPAHAPIFPERTRAVPLAPAREAAQAERGHQTGKRAYHLADLSRRAGAEYRLRSLRLVPRQWEILRLCFEHPLLCREDLVALLGIGPKAVGALLRELGSLEYLKATETATGVRWHLAETGLRLLARLVSCHVSRFVRVPVAVDAPLQQRGVKGLLHQGRHTAGLYGFCAHLATLPGVELRWWETGAICEHVFEWRGKIYHFKPDAFVGARIAGHALRFWLEWDRGTMGVRDLESKCATYAAFLTSREWVQGSSLPPALLCVFPEIAQEQRFGKTARALLAHVSGIRLYTTTMPLFLLRGLTEPIWQAVLGGASAVLPAPPALSTRVALFAEDTEG